MLARARGRVDEFLYQLQVKSHVALISCNIEDVPALRQAEVGISLSGIGSDVARWHSDMILRNDSLQDIKNAVLASRKVWSISQLLMEFHALQILTLILCSVVSVSINSTLGLTMTELLLQMIMGMLAFVLGVGYEPPT